MRAHSESERSVGYVFLMHGRVPNYHYPTPAFRKVSRRSVLGNSGFIEEVDIIFFVQLAQGFLQCGLPAVGDAVFLPQQPVL